MERKFKEEPVFEAEDRCRVASPEIDVVGLEEAEVKPERAPVEEGVQNPDVDDVHDMVTDQSEETDSDEERMAIDDDGDAINEEAQDEEEVAIHEEVEEEEEVAINGRAQIEEEAVLGEVAQFQEDPNAMAFMESSSSSWSSCPPLD